MVTLFQVNGEMVYFDPKGNTLGYEDVFQKLICVRDIINTLPQALIKRPNTLVNRMLKDKLALNNASLLSPSNEPIIRKQVK